jgi:predicted ATPase
MDYKSDIRDSEINDLLEKVKKRNYGKYLFQMGLQSIRGFKDQSIQFDFPVTALIAPNGGGKSTILGAVAACPYKSTIKQTIQIGHLFKRSKPIDNNMDGWHISYELIDKSTDGENLISKTSVYHNKWERGKLLIRDVSFSPVSRTRPATEVKNLASCESEDFKYAAKQERKLGKMVITSASNVLGKDLSTYSQIRIKSSEGKGLFLKGKTKEGEDFSEFHFGAGEASVIRMIHKIELLPENTLILIEEIENGLHPVATRKMVEYLVGVAKRKNVQIIFTTHSNEALRPLPSEAIWAIVDHTLYQGKLDVKSLRAMTGEIEASLAIFVEDAFAKDWVEAIIAESCTILDGEIGIYPCGGDGNAVKINKGNNSNPVAKCKSICIVDGDSKQKDSVEDRVYRLPGQNPEQHVFDGVYELVKNLDDSKVEELCVLLQGRGEDKKVIVDSMQEVKRTGGDTHLLYSKMANAIGFTSGVKVRNAFLRFWARHYPNERQRIMTVISRK